MGLNSSGKASSKNQQQTTNTSILNNAMVQSSGSMQPGQALNSQRVPAAANKQKLIDSKMSAWRHEQDSTATSNKKFPMSPDDAFKILNQYLWEVERREIFEYSQIYFFPVDERKKQKLNGSA